MNEIAQLREIIAGAERLVFFGGAGVSTESGIPDFRSPEGLYRAKNKYGLPPEVMLSHSFFRRDPAKFFAYYFGELVHAAAPPNDAHLVLAELETAGRLQAVITQNVDGLHQKAGSVNVLELHGSIRRNYCLECGAPYGLDFMLASNGGIPRCAKCGGLVRPGVVLYEEGLEVETMLAAEAALAQADVLIVGGTSLAVYPAAGLLEYFHGPKLVLINKSPTPFDRRADLLIHGAIGETLRDAVSR